MGSRIVSLSSAKSHLVHVVGKYKFRHSKHLECARKNPTSVIPLFARSGAMLNVWATSPSERRRGEPTGGSTRLRADAFQSRVKSVSRVAREDVREMIMETIGSSMHPV